MNELRAMAWALCFIATVLSVAFYLAGPEEHIIDTSVAYSDKRCYKETPDGVVYTCRVKLPPVAAWGDCGAEDLWEIKLNAAGELAYCTPTGWKIHQPDQ